MRTSILAPLAVVLIVVCVAVSKGETRILTVANSDRALAVESVSFTAEPFAPWSRWTPDHRTRIMLFLEGSGTLISFKSRDARMREYNLLIESVESLPGVFGIRQVVVRLPDFGNGDLSLALNATNRWVKVAILPRLTIQTPTPFQTFQRSATGHAAIKIEGTFTGEEAVLARWSNGPWFTLSVNDTRLTGALEGQVQGQGLLEIVSGSEEISIPYVGIGDVYWVAGQSNAEGRIAEPQRYEHPRFKAALFDEAGKWRELIDPTDISSVECNSIWPLLATKIMGDQNVPVAFITSATGQSGLTSHGGSGWDPLPPSGPGPNLINSINLVRSSRVNGLKAMLWYQGENDALSRDMSTAFYESRLRALPTYISQQLGFAVPVMVWQLAALQGFSETRATLDAVREAQANVWNDEHFIPGPVLYDLDILTGGDGVHIRSPEHARVEAERTWVLMKGYLYGGAPSRGPRFSSARLVDDRHVEVILSKAVAEVPTQGWRLLDRSGLLHVTGASVTGNRILLTLDRARRGSVTVSWASYNDGVGSSFRDENQMPVEPFVNKAAKQSVMF